MSNVEIARRHFEAALAEATASEQGSDSLGRYIIDVVVAHFLKTRSVDDVRRELQFMVDTVDPDTDFVFMRLRSVGSRNDAGPTAAPESLLECGNLLSAGKIMCRCVYSPHYSGRGRSWRDDSWHRQSWINAFQ